MIGQGIRVVTSDILREQILRTKYQPLFPNTPLKRIPHQTFARNVDLSREIRLLEQTRDGRTIAEISNADFARAFIERQRYEVEAGRDEEPLLYPFIYNEISDPTLPQFVPVYELGPAGVVFEEVVEGGEAKFVTVGESSYSIRIRHYATAVEYTKDLVAFNQVWSLPLIERQVGRAFNALKNHVHFSPIINHSYPAKNLTNGNSLTFDAGATYVEKILRTIEQAITDSVNDDTDRREGPYVLMVSTSNAFAIERALTRVPQEGYQRQSSAIDRIRDIVVYNGWKGNRGKVSITYPGVPSGTAFLISMGYQGQDFQSYEKQPLQSTVGNPDVTRFVLEQIVYDTYFGVYANPTRAVQKITLPNP